MEIDDRYLKHRGDGQFTFESPWGTAIGNAEELIFENRAVKTQYRAIDPKHAFSLLAQGLPLGYIVCHTPLEEILQTVLELD